MGSEMCIRDSVAAAAFDVASDFAELVVVVVAAAAAALGEAECGDAFDDDTDGIAAEDTLRAVPFPLLLLRRSVDVVVGYCCYSYSYYLCCCCCCCYCSRCLCSRIRSRRQSSNRLAFLVRSVVVVLHKEEDGTNFVAFQRQRTSG